jgi:uncharacterized protein
LGFEAEMPEDLIRYEALVLDALRGVVRAVLQRVLKRGVPGDHHFFITFDTRAPGVGLSKRLKDQYPHEMTIVLQHQFWDLAVTEDRFEVRLSFNNIPERLIIPFSAVRIFQDPTVHFALALRPPEGQDGEAGLSADMTLLPVPKGEMSGLLSPSQDLDQDLESEETAAAKPPGNEADAREGRRTAEVVSLDKFRKK